ncbi:MAG: hypothetical protein E7603_08920 [Ruminococcaceae bacterium]|nr:hypothetical protein [Oscillospiraceae bacterium]
MKYFLIHANLPADIRRSLSAFGQPVALPIFDQLPYPVCAHPDMLVAKIGDTLLVHEEYREGRALLERLGIPFSLSRAPVGMQYPEDIRLNCLATENAFFCNEKYISREALALADRMGLKKIHVSQGYAKCSCAHAKNAIATADRGIAAAALRAGVKVLLMEPSKIGIEVYDTGFIGGASVLLDENTLGFFGDIESFPVYRALADFFGEQDVRLVSLGSRSLFDYGGAIDVSL